MRKKMDAGRKSIRICIYSSARFYISGEQGKYEVMNFRELEDINLSIPSW